MSENIDFFYKDLELPEICLVNKEIDINKLINNINLTSEDKIIVSKNIKKILLRYSFNSEKIEIPKYETPEMAYDEIQLLEIEILNSISVYDIFNILVKAIPYPIIVVFRMKNKLKLGVSKFYINKKDNSKNIQNSILFTGWFSIDNLLGRILDITNKIKYRNLNKENLFEYYKNIYNVILFNQASFTTIPKFIKILENTIGSCGENDLRNEILLNCEKIIVKNDNKEIYERNKMDKYKRKSAKGCTFLICKDELWTYINKKESFKIKLEKMKIKNFEILEGSSY